MKFFHLSDLHFGKQLHGYDLSGLHREFIKQLSEHASREKPDAVLISGDIYDKSVPSALAMTLLDELLMALQGYTILIIAGNHDCAERLKYGQKFLEKNNIYISVMPPKAQNEYLKRVTLYDEYGAVNFYMLPFIKSNMVRTFMPKEASAGEESVIKALIERENIDYNCRNVILSHQFYINCKAKPEVCDSETAVFIMGGLDAVDISVLEKFDYAALGHIHGAQNIGRNFSRYCGTPLKYSVSEAKHIKAITVVNMYDKGEHIKIDTIPLKYTKDVQSIRGTLSEIIAGANESNRHNYVSITIVDEEIPDKIKDILESCYDNILEIIVDNQMSRQIVKEEIQDLKQLTPYEAFSLFFSDVSGRAMNNNEKQLFNEILAEIKEEAD